MSGGFEGGGDDKKDKRGKVIKLPTRAAQVGEAAGFRRKGKPNVERPDTPEVDRFGLLEDTEAFARLAKDILRRIEMVQYENPDLMTQDEVDAKMQEYETLSQSDSEHALEDALEEALRDGFEYPLEDKEKILSHYALATVYLDSRQKETTDN